jgi:hypothetical protein
VNGQELFVSTEPASNMAAKSIGLRLNNFWMRDIQTKNYNYHLLPEVMWGVSKSVMIHGEAFLSNRNNQLIAEGGSAYLKYRFLSVDEVHNHFRMAAFGRLSVNTSDIHQMAIDFNGHSSGYEAGLVATQLINKVAISASVSGLHATDNGNEKFLYGDQNRNAVNYTLSVGKLMLPKEYTSYNQTNVNFMVELLGQSNTGNGYNYLDVAPAVQFIIASRMRVDLGYRYPLVDRLQRTAPKGYIVKLEYNIFNLY